MEIRLPKKSELVSRSSATSNSPSNSTSEPNEKLESIFVKLTAKLPWEGENIEPELGKLYPY